MRIMPNDLEAHWMPFTSNKHFKNTHTRMMTEGKGILYKTYQGHELIDAVSGLFCSPLGHARPEIAEAVYAQLKEMSYCPPFQHGHPSAFELARRISQLLPGNLDYIFYGSSGSEAVETTLKIALLYHRVKGEGQRQRLVGREKGYHGVNFGGFSVGGMVKNREMYGLGIPGVVHMRHTNLPKNKFARDEGEHGVELAEDLQRLCDTYGGDTIAACIVEPVGGSVGAYLPPKGYLKRLREICDEHGILLIFDEVITGFGRTGNPFGADTYDVQPDMVTMAKALTNGAIPMSAVGVSDHIYKTIVDAAPEKGVDFFHGYTYSGHPAACAAGLATLDLFEKEDMFARAKALSNPFLDRFFDLKDLPVVTNMRGVGMLAALDMAPDGAPGTRGYQAVQDLYEKGLLVKITGDTIMLSPAFICEEADFDRMFEILRGVLSTY
jgi:beta-alanine--pyruvate transaminase